MEVRCSKRLKRIFDTRKNDKKAFCEGGMEMNRIVTGLLVLFFLTMALAPALVFSSEQKATPPGTELYVHKSPAFTVTVPSNWAVSDKSRNPACVLRKAQDPYEVTTFEISVADLPKDLAYTDLVEGLIEFFEDKYGATDCKKLYERDTKLKDGTPAYELEVEWKHPAILLYTYQLVVFKDQKRIWVSVTSGSPVSDQLKQIPYSLTLK
jgi:hypothetical protein